MNFNITCPSCNQKSKMSTRDADKIDTGNDIIFSWDCPKCKNEIEARRKKDGKPASSLNRRSR